ncbi:hypothetical protein AB0O22_22535 [Streptomyces sp. NPDC091204]|uniref:hypothetical protein n=1 Tax=Streptomyces sp. NPDC091204 TaxID=3155299 RepID=UPI00343E015E
MVEVALRARPGRAQHSDTGAVQPPRHLAQHLGGGRVEPLHVVHGQQDRPPVRQPAQAFRDRVVVGRRAGPAPLDGGESAPEDHRRLPGRDRAEQLDEAAVAQPCPVLHARGGEDAHTARGGPVRAVASRAVWPTTPAFPSRSSGRPLWTEPLKKASIRSGSASRPTNGPPLPNGSPAAGNAPYMTGALSSWLEGVGPSSC